MSVLNQSGEEQVECPLCMEPLEVDDLYFFPCTCGYQICRFCWHRIRTDENGLCPACRKGYPENPADFKPLSQEEVSKLKAEKRHKDQQRKQKITENRKHLANVRVVQRNLVFVVGLPMRLAESEVLKKHEYFGKFGRIHKVVINQCTSYAGTQGPSASAYVTYHRADDALRAIQAVNNIVVDGRAIKSSLGTTKYCSHYMKNQACPKPDCMYLHEQGRGDPEASFTKEEMQQGKHQEYEKKLHDQLIAATASRERKPTPSPPAVAAPATAAMAAVTAQPPAQQQQQSLGGAAQGGGGKEAWPSLQGGVLGGPNGGTNGNMTTGNNGTAKVENGRKLSGTKNPSVGKKRHSSGDDTRGKTKDKPPAHCTGAPGGCGGGSGGGGSDSPYDPPDDSPAPSDRSTSDSDESGSEEGSTSASDDPPPTRRSPTPAAAVAGGVAGARVAGRSAAASLFEQDNNSSFFSSNSFTKVAGSAHGAGLDWGSPQSHLPDMMPLPTVHPTEDWQAAFGFSAPLEADSAPSRHHHHHHPHHPPPPPHTAKYNGHLPSSEPFADFAGHDPPANPGRLFTSLHSPFTLQQQQQQQSLDPTLYRQHQYLVGTTQQQHQQQQQQQTQQQHNGMPPTTSKFFSEYNLRHAQPPPPPPESPFGPPSSAASHLHDGFSKPGGSSANFAKHSEPPPNNSYLSSGCGGDALYDYRPGFGGGGRYRCGGQHQNGGGKEEEGDDWGFDMFHETQKALAEMMEKEAVVAAVRQATQPPPPPPQQQQQHYPFGQPPPQSQSQQQQGLFGQQQQQQMQQNHRLSGNSVSGCSRLLDGLGLGPTPQRSRLPPPGFSPAPNHMNAFGLGIPRPPTNNTGSKILPFMNLTGQTAPSATSPTAPHPSNGGPQSILFPPPPSPRSSAASAAASSAPFNGMKQPPPPLDLQFSAASGAPHKDWADNLRVFTASPPPQTTAQPPPHTGGFGGHGAALKGWTGPCTDWTALDPAIVSSTRPPTQQQQQQQQQQQHNPLLLPAQQQQHTTQHWLRHLEDSSSGVFLSGAAPNHHHNLLHHHRQVDWAQALSAPPPGFSLRQQAQAAGINKALAAGAEMTKIENL